jgi:hypothetical protein
MNTINFLNENVDKSLPTLSISQILTLIQKPFDQEGVAQKTFDKHFNNPESQYYQKTVEQICEMWSAKGAESCKYGSLLDDYIGLNLTGTPEDIEMYKLDNDVDSDERLSGLIKSFDEFYALLKRSGDTEFVDREKTIYYTTQDGNLVKGRFDALFRNKRTGKWIIIDWKSSGSIDKSKTPWTESLLGPAKLYPALNWYTYTIQLYFYKKALIESGYLPQGTTYDDVEVMIVQLPGKECHEGQYHLIHKPAFQFDSEFLNSIFSFAFKKNMLMKR